MQDVNGCLTLISLAFAIAKATAAFHAEEDDAPDTAGDAQGNDDDHRDRHLVTTYECEGTAGKGAFTFFAMPQISSPLEYRAEDRVRQEQNGDGEARRETSARIK